MDEEAARRLMQAWRRAYAKHGQGREAMVIGPVRDGMAEFPASGIAGCLSGGGCAGFITDDGERKQFCFQGGGRDPEVLKALHHLALRSGALLTGDDLASVGLVYDEGPSGRWWGFVIAMLERSPQDWKRFMRDWPAIQHWSILDAASPKGPEERFAEHCAMVDLFAASIRALELAATARDDRRSRKEEGRAMNATHPEREPEAEAEDNARSRKGDGLSDPTSTTVWPRGEYLREVGRWVAGLVPPGSRQREWFRQRLSEAVAIERTHYDWSMARQNGEAERLRREEDHYAQVKADPRLRDRTAGPPPDHLDWTWQDWLAPADSEVWESQEEPQQKLASKSKKKRQKQRHEQCGRQDAEQCIQGWGPPDLRGEAAPPSLIPSLLDRTKREPGRLLAWRCFQLAVIHDATPGYESSRLVDDPDLPLLLEYLRRCVQRRALVGSLATTDVPFRDQRSDMGLKYDALNTDEIEAARRAVEAELAAIHTSKAETDAAGGAAQMDLVTPGHTGGSRVSMKEKPWAYGAPSAPSVMVPDDATLSVDKLAETFGVGKEALRKRLGRLRRKDHTCFVEVADRASREAQFIYKVGKVRPVIEALRTSGRTSGKRPAKKNSP